MEFVVLRYLDRFTAEVVSRHRSASAARKSAEKHRLNTELNVFRIHTGEVPAIGERIARVDMRERFRNVPLENVDVGI